MGLRGRLLLLTFGSLGAILAVMIVVAVGVARYSTWRQASILTGAQAAGLRAAFLALPHDGRGMPAAGSLWRLRRELQALRPGLGFEVIAGGVTLDGRALTPLQQRAAAAVRAAPGQPFFEIDGPSGEEVFTRVEALDGTASTLLEIHAPLALMRRQENQLRFTAVVRLGAGLSLICLALFIGIRQTAGRVTRLARSVARQAASSDFSAPIARARGNDEIADLGVAVEVLGRQLRSTLVALDESSGKLAGASGALAENAAEQAGLLERQERSIREAIRSAEEIKRTSETAADRAGAVLEAANEARKLGEAGEAAVRRTLEALDEIREQVGEVGRRLSILADRAQQIADVTTSVKELADSSNMLALNAAIEAVRSGGPGRGFGLVAREMRNLATQSILATEHVREILDHLVGSIRQASAISSRGTQRIEAGLDQLARSGASLRELALVTGESSQSAQVIAAAVQQQNAGVVHIARALADRDQVARRTAEELSRTRASVRALQEVTSQVKGLLQGYRL